ncbi:MAG: hypothetical protein IIA12_03810, partial [Proteobacteria bacterium]|nr:hypothetical protein [Pseudomonadota bacterium]
MPPFVAAAGAAAAGMGCARAARCNWRVWAMETFEGFWRQVVAVWSTGIFGVSLGEVLLAVVIFFVFLVARRLFSRFIIRTVKALTVRTKTTVDDEILAAIEEPLRFVFVVVGVYAAGQ